ncbi:MAG: amidohydrolase [Myxococcales bacterium]|nr:amidohydrolase [Myxococcales bacterium]
MRNGMPLLDIDRHVVEPLSMWPEYLPAAYRDVAPDARPLAPPGESLDERLARLGPQALLPTPPILTVQGRPLIRGMSERAYVEANLHVEERRHQLIAGGSAAGQLADMDATGVDLAMLLPTHAGFLVYDDEIDAGRSRAYADAYNRWLADLCQEAPQRLLGAVLLSRHDPTQMVSDLEAGLKRGLCAAVIRPNPVQGRTLGAPELDPFYAACVAHDIPLLLHEGTHTRVETVGATRFASHFAQHVCSHPLEMMMAFLSLLEAGVFERHPRLRVAFLEAGCGFLPYWLWRIDHAVEVAQVNELGGHVRQRPSGYFRRQCWIALEPTEPLLPQNIDHIGTARVVFGTDFPHIDHDAGILADLFADRTGLRREVLQAVVWDNPLRLLGPRSASLAEPWTRMPPLKGRAVEGLTVA